ncbi:MAG: type II toxin-antitoxin system RelE/ParE family toxin [Prevotella sp.]|nr:type II toxin-antitoxin system RelE/ParE family toxin [Candidatus Prevotella equi]
MKCKWTRRAESEYEIIVKYIFNEFGKKAAYDFIASIEYWDGRINKFPEIGVPEPLLADRKNYKYRSYIVSKHNKFIYTINNDEVTIVDIWDMRRHPDNLSKRIKSK